MITIDELLVSFVIHNPLNKPNNLIVTTYRFLIILLKCMKIIL